MLGFIHYVDNLRTRLSKVCVPLNFAGTRNLPLKSNKWTSELTKVEQVVSTCISYTEKLIVQCPLPMILSLMSFLLHSSKCLTTAPKIKNIDKQMYEQ